MWANKNLLHHTVVDFKSRSLESRLASILCYIIIDIVLIRVLKLAVKLQCISFSTWPVLCINYFALFI